MIVLRNVTHPSSSCTLYSGVRSRLVSGLVVACVDSERSGRLRASWTDVGLLVSAALSQSSCVHVAAICFDGHSHALGRSRSTLCQQWDTHVNVNTIITTDP